MNQRSTIFTRPKTIGVILLLGIALAISSIGQNCRSQPPTGFILNEDEVLVNFELSTGSRMQKLMIWQDGEKVYECRVRRPDELTGAGQSVRLPVKIDGESFRFKIKWAQNEHEAFLVPFPVTYSETSDNFVYLGVISHTSSEIGWRVGMRTEPVYYE